MKIAPAIATLALLSLPATGTTPVEGRDASRGLPTGGNPAELDAYIESVSARFAIQDRQTDMFGRYQDPNMLPLTEQARPLLKPDPLRIVSPPFPDVVQAIEVDTIIPGKKQFLVGSRKFSVNDTIPLRLPTGKTVKAQVMEVSPGSITFRNPATGETAVRKLSTLPDGMMHDTPGIQSTTPTAPIEIKTVAPQHGPVDRIIRPDHPMNFIADSRPSK